MNLKLFTPVDHQDSSFIIAKVGERAIFGEREVVANQSRAYQQDSLNERLKELREKESNKTITHEEAAELFEIALGIE